MVEKIQSFRVDHDFIVPGIYISRIDGDVTTYDLRTRKPNCGDYMDNLTMHSTEHMFATYIRSSAIGDKVIYFGPMGCQTGFYFLFDEDKLPVPEAVKLLQLTFTAAARYMGEMPGKSARECGNYVNLDIDLARACCGFYAKVIENWTVEKLVYPE